MPVKRYLIAEEVYSEGRKTQGQVSVEADRHDKVVVHTRSEQGYAPGARGYSVGGVVALSAEEARALAAVLLAAADQAEALPEDYEPAQEALKVLRALKED